MAISNFFHLFFLLQIFFKYLTHFQSAKNKSEIRKKVQIILQTSGESIKEDMALLA